MPHGTVQSPLQSESDARRVRARAEPAGPKDGGGAEAPPYKGEPARETWKGTGEPREQGSEDPGIDET